MCMSISGIYGVSGYGAFTPIYNASPIRPVGASEEVSRGTDGTAQATVDGAKDAARGKSSRVEKGECQTCKNRKYVDGSNESDVSFKTPAHINPNNAAAVVMGHEKEHMANAIAEGNEANKELVSASISLKTSVCPECGRVYVSGGVTHTTMRTTTGGSEPVNPYEKRQADLNYLMASGANFDLTA